MVITCTGFLLVQEHVTRIVPTTPSDAPGSDGSPFSLTPSLSQKRNSLTFSPHKSQSTDPHSNPSAPTTAPDPDPAPTSLSPRRRSAPSPPLPLPHLCRPSTTADFVSAIPLPSPSSTGLGEAIASLLLLRDSFPSSVAATQPLSLSLPHHHHHGRRRHCQPLPHPRRSLLLHAGRGATPLRARSQSPHSPPSDAGPPRSSRLPPRSAPSAPSPTSPYSPLRPRCSGCIQAVRARRRPDPRWRGHAAVPSGQIRFVSSHS